MNIPILSSAAQHEATPALLVHFTDGTAATLADLGVKMRGRHLDQIERIEVYPTGGQRIDGSRGPQVIRGLTLTLEGVPFDLWTIFPLPAAMQIGQILMEPPMPGAAPFWTP